MQQTAGHDSFLGFQVSAENRRAEGTKKAAGTACGFSRFHFAFRNRHSAFDMR